MAVKVDTQKEIIFSSSDLVMREFEYGING